MCIAFSAHCSGTFLSYEALDKWNIYLKMQLTCLLQILIDKEEEEEWEIELNDSEAFKLLNDVIDALLSIIFSY